MSRVALTRRLAASLGLLILLFANAHAGYDLSISSSSTDPDENTSALPVGLDSLFIWVKCADEGISAFEADLDGNISVLGFNPRPGVLNAGTSTSLLLGIADCPTGDEIDIILGSVVVWDSSSAGGRLSLIESSNFDWPVVTSCGDGVIAFIPRIVGFASDGSPPDSSGAEYGCGYFPESPAAEPTGFPPVEWSDAFGNPATGGDGTNNDVAVIRNMASQSNAMIVAGKFTDAGDLSSAPQFAKLVVDVSGGDITTTWSLPTNWGDVPSLGSGESYLGADSDPNGGMALAGNKFTQPFVYCPPSGNCFEGSPAPTGADESMLSDVEYWSENGRYLVGGEFHASEWPDAGERVGLAQFNPSTSSWEDFGYPTIGSNVRYWVGPDYDWHVNEILEVNLPGLPLDAGIVIGGDFEYVFGNDDLTIAANNVALLSPTDWRFGEIGTGGGIRGVIYALAQSPSYAAGDGGIYVYASGNFGLDEGNPGLEWPAVVRSDFSGTYAGEFQVLENGGVPYGGPMKSGTLEYARVYGMVATDDHLYVVGDFDRVRTQGGPFGFTEFAGRFARFSFATETWESMGQEGLSDIGLAVEVNWPAAFIGGEFLEVDGSIPSYHIAQANFLEAVSAPELWADNPGKLAPVQLETPRPNPTHGGTQIGYAVPQRMEVDLAIFDVSGRLVRQVVKGWKDSGEYVGIWDGRTERGERAVAGVYLARLSAGDVELTKKIVLVK